MPEGPSLSLAARIAELHRRFEGSNWDEEAFEGSLEALLGSPSAPGPWISGTFDGHYTLVGPEDHGARLQPRGGVLTGLTRGDRPPPPQRIDLPWLAETLEDVQVATSPQEALPVTLQDVRLHQVNLLHHEEGHLRVRGTLWGRLVLEAEPQVPSSSPLPEKAPVQDVATSHDGLVVYGPDTREVEGTGHGEGSGASLGCALVGLFGLPILVAVLASLWLVGGPVSTALWFGVVGGFWVGHGRVPSSLQGSGRGGCLGTLGVLALAGVVIGGVAWQIGSDPCADRTLWSLSPVLLPLVAALGVHWRATGVLAVGAWSVGLWLWSTVPEAGCAIDSAEMKTLGSVRMALRETLDHLEEAMVHDPVADLLEQATDVGGDPRRSLDSALAGPASWSCGLPVHLSATVLFDESSGELRPEASATLRRLGRLLRRVEGPVRLEGHGPEVGLSGVRARAVTSWLESQAGISSTRLITVGVGADHPLVQQESLVHFNQRIDVVRPCP